MRILLSLFFIAMVAACTSEQDAEPASAATFIKLFGGENSDVGSLVLETTDQGFIILGTTETENDDGTSNFQIRLIKTDEFGNTEWDRFYPSEEGAEDNFTGNSLILRDDGYLLIGDRIHDNETTSMYLLHVDLNGEEIMNNSITITNQEDTISSHGIDLLDNGNNELKITGKVESSSQNMYLGTINTTDLSAIPSCTFRYSSASSNPSIFKSICIEGNGDVVFGAAVNNNSRLIRVPTCQNSQITGPLIQSQSSATYTANQIVKSISGYAMVGTTNANTNEDIFLARVNDLGASPQIKIYSEVDGIVLNDQEEGLTVALTNDGGFIIGGYTRTATAGELDMFIIKTDFKGDVQWSQRFGDQNEEEAVFIRQTSDGGYIILGNTEFGGIDTMTLIKTDNKGQVK